MDFKESGTQSGAERGVTTGGVRGAGGLCRAMCGGKRVVPLGIWRNLPKQGAGPAFLSSPVSSSFLSFSASKPKPTSKLPTLSPLSLFNQKLFVLLTHPPVLHVFLLLLLHQRYTVIGFVIDIVGVYFFFVDHGKKNQRVPYRIDQTRTHKPAFRGRERKRRWIEIEVEG